MKIVRWLAGSLLLLALVGVAVVGVIRVIDPLTSLDVTGSLFWLLLLSVMSGALWRWSRARG